MSVLSKLLNGVLEINPSANVIDYQNQWHTWGELKGAMDAIRGCLGQLGLGEGARIGVLVRNRPDELAAVMTAVSLDACIVSINPLLPEQRLLSDLKTLRLPAIVATPADLERPGVLDAIKHAGSAVIELEPLLRGAHLRQGFEAITGADIHATDPDIIIEMLTSGTTGSPKRIPLQRQAYERSFVGALSYEKGRKPDDPAKLRSGTQLLTNPMTHIGGLWHAMAAILGGRKLCLIEKFSVEAWRDAVVRHRPKIAGAVPAGLRMLLDANLPADVFSSLVALRSGTAPLDPAVVDEFLERYDLPVLQNYGATEFAGAVAGWSLADFRKHYKRKRGSVGRFQPGVEGRVVDAESGLELRPGEEGVLEMRAAQFGNGGAWLRTTDRAMLDSDSFLFIRGRADNTIIRGGFKIHPDDVVKVLEQHPAVREAVVVGVTNSRLGAVPAAAIMLKSGAPAVSDADLAAFVRERMLPYQVPAHFKFVDDVPRTASLKPMLPQVRALFEGVTCA